jgi:hypothetical protein
MRLFFAFLLVGTQILGQNYYTPRNVYDFSVGDTLEFYISGGTQFTQYQYSGTTRHSIMDKLYNIDSSEVCYITQTYSYKRSFNSSTGNYDTTWWYGNDLWCYTNLDSNLAYLPEYNYASVYDSIELASFIDTNCQFPSVVNYVDTIELDNSLNQWSNAHNFNLSENCFFYQNTYQSFKNGFGKVKNQFSIENFGYVQYNDTILQYIVKNGVPYGLSDPVLSVQETSQNNVGIIQNPVIDFLEIKGFLGKAILYDALGRELKCLTFSNDAIDVSFLQQGYYFIKPIGMITAIKFYKR